MAAEKKIRKTKPLFLPLTAGVLFLFGVLLLNSEKEKNVPAAAQPEERTVLLFQTDPKTAFSEAAADQKPILLFVTDEKCPFSRKMLNETFSAPEVKQICSEFVCLSVDADNSDKIPSMSSRSIEGTPTVLFLSCGGDLINQTVRYQSSAELVEQMETVLHRAAWNVSGRILR